MGLPEDRFHRHSLGQLLARSIQLLRQEWQAFFQLTAIVILPAVVFNAICFKHLHTTLMAAFVGVGVENINDYDNYNNNNNDTDQAAAAINDVSQQMMAMLRNVIWIFIVVMVLVTIVKAAMIRTTVQSFLRTRVSLATNLRHGVDRFPHMCLWFLIYVVGVIAYAIVVGIVLGLIMLVAYFLLGQDLASICYIVLQVGNLFLTYYITLVLVFCMPTIVVERVSALKSFVRAWEMADGHRCMILCTLLSLLLASIIFFAIEYLIFGGFGWTALAVVHGISLLFWFPMGTIATTMLYLNIRVDKEGCNAEVLKSELDKGDADLGLVPTSEHGADTYHTVPVHDDEHHVQQVLGAPLVPSAPEDSKKEMV